MATLEIIKKPKNPVIIEKKSYTVHIEGTVPVTFIFNIEAETPEQALQQAQRSVALRHPTTNHPSPRFSQLRIVEGKVYQLGTKMLELIRKLK